MNWFIDCKTVVFSCIIRLKSGLLVSEPYLFPDSYGWFWIFWYLNRTPAPILTVKIGISGIWTVSLPRFLRLKSEFLVSEPYPCHDSYGWIWTFWLQDRTGSSSVTQTACICMKWFQICLKNPGSQSFRDKNSLWSYVYDLINVWVTENTGKSRGYTESCCKYVTNPWLFTAIEDISLII